MRPFKNRTPWRNSVITTTVLSLAALLGSQLWQAGYPHWAFVLGYSTVCLVIAIFWSNDGFNEKSDQILA